MKFHDILSQGHESEIRKIVSGGTIASYSLFKPGAQGFGESKIHFAIYKT
jgi:hypothetical protein